MMDYVSSSGAPKAIGPYSAAVKANGFLFASGQTPLDPATMNLVEGDFSAQVHRVFKNLEAVLRDGGTDFSRVVRTSVYLTDLANFAALNTIYAQYFGDHKPARTTIGVKELPRGAAVEIDMIALV